MAGETDLAELLRSMHPEARAGEFVVVVSEATDLLAEAVIRESEGTTLVLRREVADAAGLPYEYVAAWITLTVHSSLAAVGLTAAVSTTLAEAGISCNVVAAFHHDHLLVPADRADDALAALVALAER